MRYGNTHETREALVYAAMHEDRELHLDAARRARSYQAQLAAIHEQRRARIAAREQYYRQIARREQLAGVATLLALALAAESFAVVLTTLYLEFHK